MNKFRRILSAGLAVLVTLISASWGQASAAGAHALIQGSGSSWAANAVAQWITDVHANGLQVVFTSSGSAQGRTDFANKTTDFGVSDIGYLGTDPVSGATDTSKGRKYAYLPIVAGGTAFPYQLHIGSKRVDNLRLSGDTLTKIFTNQISTWNDPHIKADNPGLNLPAEPIIPVVHSEGSGSTYQFTRYMSTVYGSQWNPFGKGATEYFPRQGGQVAQNGSDGVMSFISSGAGEGSIGFDEYSYAKSKGYPVAKVLNSAGYYTLPSQYNVAVALTKAQINQDKSDPTQYLLQNLNNVYTDPDPRTYPVSSYSYMILPIGTNDEDSKMTTAKRQTLADYLYYSICQGQAEIGPTGYSSLPINLVQAGFSQIGLLHTADSGVNLTNENVGTCNNPTFVAGHPEQNHLAQIAPYPPACDKQGSSQCLDSVITLGSANGGNGTVSTGGGNSGSGSRTGSGSGSGSGSGPRSGAGPRSTGRTGTGTTGSGRITTGSSRVVSTSSGANTATTGGNTTVDPNTGQVVSDGSGSGADVTTNSTALADAHTASTNTVLILIAGLLLLALLVVPPVVAMRMRSGSKS